MNIYLAEFVGTLILILLGNGAVANVVLKKSKGQGGGWIVITAGWGFAVAMAVYSVGRISGAHINPAVTIGLASVGEFEWALVPGYVISQTAGAFTGAVLVYLTYLPHWAITEDQGLKLATFSTGPAVRNPIANLITEIIGTVMLVFGVLSLVSISAGMSAPEGTDVAALSLHETMVAGLSAFITPMLVGILVFSIGLSLGGPTGYAINPARDLGPRLAHAVLPIAGKGSSDWSYAWIPIVGPIVGGVLGATLFKLCGF
ncbi:MAG: MIP/aquaporin family protein [Puniceicoccaceae bacterium]